MAGLYFGLHILRQASFSNRSSKNTSYSKDYEREGYQETNSKLYSHWRYCTHHKFSFFPLHYMELYFDGLYFHL